VARWTNLRQVIILQSCRSAGVATRASRWRNHCYFGLVVQSATARDQTIHVYRLFLVDRLVPCRSRLHDEAEETVVPPSTRPRRNQTIHVYRLFLRLRNDLYRVEWGVKLYSLTHRLFLVRFHILHDDDDRGFKLDNKPRSSP